MRAAVAEAIKVVLDAGVTATSARYQWLRVREEALTEAELAAWDSLQERLQREPALAGIPAEAKATA